MSIYLFQLAAQKAEWLSARQTAIASNVANANTPGYRAIDVAPFAAVLDKAPMVMAATSSIHLAPSSFSEASYREIEAAGGEATLSGNTVGLEQQMIALGDVSRDFTMTANVRRAFHQLLMSALK